VRWVPWLALMREHRAEFNSKVINTASNFLCREIARRSHYLSSLNENAIGFGDYSRGSTIPCCFWYLPLRSA